MNGPWPALLAALDDFILPAVVILFLVISALGQVLAKIREAQQAEERRRGAAARPVGPPSRPLQPASDPLRQDPLRQDPLRQDPLRQDPLRQEVGEFVRQGRPAPAAGRQPRQEPWQAAPPAQGQPGPFASPQPPQPRPAPFGPYSPPPPPVQPAEVELVELLPEESDQRGELRKPLAEPPFGKLSSNVGTGLAESDRAMREHVKEIFDHHVGTLEDARRATAGAAAAPPAQAAPLPATAAAGLAAMLADGVSLRQAIVLNEILQRPEHRWQ